MDTGTTVVFLAVVGARFVVPLFIPRFPLPAILAALVLDGVDQTIFQTLGYDPPGYQGYDKAMDVYYLSIAYLSTLRNWTSRRRVRGGRFLFFYRLVGVVAFEAHRRALLLIFPNTFEYFFIAYEVVRAALEPAAAAVGGSGSSPPPRSGSSSSCRRSTGSTSPSSTSPTRCATTPWLWPLAGRRACSPPSLVAGSLRLRPRLPAPDWALRLAADPLPDEIDTAAKRAAWRGRARATAGRCATLEKIVLVGLVCVIYGEVLPDVRSSGTALFLGVGVFVVVNAALSLAVSRRARSVDSAVLAFGVRVVVNVVLVLLAGWLLRRGDGSLNVRDTLFFVFLLSLITLLYDRYRPVADARLAGTGAGGPGRGESAAPDDLKGTADR